MLPEVCRELAIVISLNFPQIAGEEIKKLTEVDCIKFNNQMVETRAKIVREREENTPEALRRKGYIVCEKKGELTACK